MGDWRPNPDPTSTELWLYDPDAPTPITPSDYDPGATRVGIPAVTPAGRLDFQGAVDWAWPPDRPTFTRDDGSVYERPDPDEFDCFDDVDSTTIVDDGGPDG